MIVCEIQKFIKCIDDIDTPVWSFSDEIQSVIVGINEKVQYVDSFLIPFDFFNLYSIRMFR